MDKRLDELTFEDWAHAVLPEWGQWLAEEIERAEVAPGTCALWWLGNMGVWIRDDAGTNLAIDVWCGTGKRTHDLPPMGPTHHYRRMAGALTPQPSRRAIPMLLDPFQLPHLDALLATHPHHDHIDRFVAAGYVRSQPDDARFVGPQAAVEQWLAWGVPAERCCVVHPGDVLQVGTAQVEVVESFDRTMLITDLGAGAPDAEGLPNMDELAVGYVVRTSAAGIYHGGDSQFSVRMYEQGRAHQVDVALVAFGENPPGIQDKMTSSDILRTAEALGCELVVPLHWDAWANSLADPHEVLELWRMRRERMRYRFHPLCWMPGGSLVWPRDRELQEYAHPRGLDDAGSVPSSLPYPSFL